MKYLSLFSGIEAATVAWEQLRTVKARRKEAEQRKSKEM